MASNFGRRSAVLAVDAMRPLRLSLLALAAALALPAAASSAPPSTSFAIVGYEYAFTSTVGSFAGNGSGNEGGTAYWNATVKHDRLGSNPTYVNGGSFAMAIRGPGSSSMPSSGPSPTTAARSRRLTVERTVRTRSTWSPTR
jgi:hypothetical protein